MITLESAPARYFEEARRLAPSPTPVKAPSDSRYPRQPKNPASRRRSSRHCSTALSTPRSAHAGRRALPSSTLTAVLEALVDRGGRAHRDTVASAAGVPTSAFEPTMSALKRLLNIEGYAVVSLDPDGTTVVLDVALLREQFALRP
jgi:hypothetical protein